MESRRSFIRKSAVGTAAMSIPGALFPNLGMRGILGANEKVVCACIGIRSRGKAHVLAINAYPNAFLKYNCDVDDLILEEHNAWCETYIGRIPDAVKDFRKILDDPEVDAVFIATPEHWHAPMAIMALQAGKHVYVEKPCSHNPKETEMLIEAQRKYGKLVQMGNQQRSAETSISAIRDIREGIIGKVFKGEAYYSNNRESIGHGMEVPVPETLDWELWQGPAPRTPYRDNVHPYNWHWFRNWGTGEIHNNGTHEIDICRWGLGVDFPVSVTSFGGKFTYDDDWEFPDNQQVTYTFANGSFLTWTSHSRGVMKPERPGRGITLYGEKGSIELSRNDYRVYDLGGRPIKVEYERELSATTDTQGIGSLDVAHVANFFDAIRTGVSLNAPIADAGISTQLCHLGNLAQDAGHTLEIDSATGHILNDKQAMKSWGRTYEKGWELKV